MYTYVLINGYIWCILGFCRLGVGLGLVGIGLAGVGGVMASKKHGTPLSEAILGNSSVSFCCLEGCGRLRTHFLRGAEVVF